MQMPPRIRALAIFALVPTMSGCASLDGQAIPVLSVAAVTEVANAYPPKTALEEFYRKGTNEADQRAYRDKVIGAYLAAADIRYLEFRRDLSREIKSSNLLLDIAVLGLTGGASLAGEKTANALSAGAAGLVGTRASLSKELWFDKTLPALIAAMNARRTDIRGQILTRMQASPQAYSLAEAFADLARYQEAATLDSAIETVTAAASAKSIEADKRYAGVVLTYSGPPPAAVVATRVDLKARIDGAPDDKLDAIASAVGATPGAKPDDTRAAILQLMYAPATDLADFSGKIATVLGAN